MKKMVWILLIILISLGLSGCSSQDDLEALENRIIALEEALAEMQMINIELENSIADLTTLNTGYASSISNQNTTITQLQNSLHQIEATIASEINVFLAEEYYLAPNDTFQLFYRSVIQAVNPYGFYIRLVGTVGHAYNRYYEWTPGAEHVGNTYNLTLEVRDDNGKIYGTGTTKLIVSQANTQMANRRVLCIGDSLTANGYWVSYGYQKYLQAGGGAIELLGTITGGYNTTVKYEGRGGWQWSSYVSGYGSTPSPFQSATGTFSFIDYCTRNGYSGIDELYILMTWNGIGGTFRTFTMYTEPMYSAKVFIDKFHNEYPNAKVTLLGIPQPSVNSGLGAYYTISSSYGNNYGQFVTALNYNKQLETFATSTGYSDFMRFVDVKAQFDCEYNMPTAAKPVNNQSSTTELVGTSMGMHPTTQGYLQIGDVFYRALCKNWD